MSLEFCLCLRNLGLGSESFLYLGVLDLLSGVYHSMGSLSSADGLCAFLCVLL